MNERDATRDRLLVAARTLFARRGFAGAWVRAITERARANLGAVTYHFGSKQAIYRAVLDQLFRSLGGGVAAAAAPSGAAAERLRAIIHAFFAFFGESPEAPGLILHRLAAGAPPPPAVVRQFRPVVDAIIATVRDGQERGVFGPVEPLLATFTVVSQTVWFAVARGMIATVSGVPFDRPEMAAVVERHIAEVARRTLAPGRPGA